MQTENNHKTKPETSQRGSTWWAKFEFDVCKHEVNSNQMLKLHEARKHHGSKV